MGLLDNLLGGLFGGGLKGVTDQLESGALSEALSKTNLNDLGGLVAKLQQGGLQAQVKSWLGDGNNLPVTKDQLKAALDNEQVKQMAAHFGLSTDRALELLAKYLPDAVDKASPNGTLQPTS
jgi:uncharacterized protein YidB (DUF937 family)